LLPSRNTVSSCDRLVSYLGVLFAPLDVRLRKSIRSATISAAATVAIVAFIVVVPGILVVGSLLNEAAKSVTVISPMLDADHWVQLLDNHPRLAPALRWINERLDLPDLIQAAVSWIAGRSGPIVRASFSGAINLLLTFYFCFTFFEIGKRPSRWREKHCRCRVPNFRRYLIDSPTQYSPQSWHRCCVSSPGRPRRRHVLVARVASPGVLGSTDGSRRRGAISWRLCYLGASGLAPRPFGTFCLLKREMLGSLCSYPGSRSRGQS
jgi:hypothetical protein